MRFLLKASIMLLSMGFSLSATLSAFDGDLELSNPNFVKDNFLDIKSYQPNKLREQEWQSTLNGFRLIVGSLDMKFAYVAMEIRFYRPITDRLTIRYEAIREEFYAIKPLKQTLDLQLRIVNQFYLAMVGFPAYDKRSGDLGGALIWGNPGENYFRIAHIEQDVFYNEKNLENDFYVQAPIEDQLTGRIQLTKQFKMEVDWLREHPVEQVFPDQNLTFKFEGQQGKLGLEYQLDKNQQWGWKTKVLEHSKKRLTSQTIDGGERREQVLKILSSEIYWIQTLQTKYTLVSGIQYDLFHNEILDLQTASESFVYTFDTGQVYAFFIHPWNPQLNWEYAFFLGQVKEQTLYDNAPENDEVEEGLEHKFRLSWDWHTADPFNSFNFYST